MSVQSREISRGTYLIGSNLVLDNGLYSVRFIEGSGIVKIFSNVNKRYILICEYMDEEEQGNNKLTLIKGMLISVEPVHLAMKTIPNLDHAKKLLMSPSGKTFNQAKAIELSKEEHIVMVCGHYEGIDARILNFIDEEVSIGDYVLMGGEVPAMTILEAVSRLVPGVISEDSPVNESFSDSLLEHPQYTRPAIYEGLGVPDVLLSGHHANIKKWQREKALEKTLKVRPDLLKKANLDLNDYKYLWELKNEKN